MAAHANTQPAISANNAGMTPLDALTAFFNPLRTHAWGYPMLEVLHIFGIALLMGNLVALELRVWGSAKAIAPRELAKLSLSLAVAGFCLAAFSGLIMFASQAAELLANRAFVIKMLLITLAACNAAWFHGRDSLGKLDAIAKLQTFASTLIWLAAMVCGRWIAYL
jgi:uncharacterized membrane protein